MSNFQNPKVPPTGGSHLPHAHPSSFEIQIELDHGRRVTTDPASWSQQLDLAIVGLRGGAGADAAVDYFL